jgi:SM-20-related protein
MKAQFEELVDSFIDYKVGIDTNFLSASLANNLQDNIRALNSEGAMSYAGVGNDAIRQKQQFRGDKIYWMDKKSKDLNELAFLEHVENFIDYLNNTCYTGINSYEFHYALYEEGSSYKRHRDQFNNDSGRKYSLISYLNEDWLTTDGGQLLIYKEGETQSILPNTQKAVFFKSDEMEHEVTVATRQRMSVTGWLKRV